MPHALPVRSRRHRHFLAFESCEPRILLATAPIRSSRFLEDGTALAVTSSRSGESLQLPGTTGQTVEATFTLSARLAKYRSEVGLYRVDDTNGRIGNLGPGQRGYALAALERRTVLFLPRQQKGAVTRVELAGGGLYGTYLIQNSTSQNFLARRLKGHAPQVFFSFKAANGDKTQHVRQSLHGVLFFEDQTGGGDRDFNDVIFRTSYKIKSGGTPGSPPDTTPPEVIITSPADGLLTVHDVTVIGQAADDKSGVSTVAMRLVSPGTSASPPNFVPIPFDTATATFQSPLGLKLDGSADGTYSVFVHATDKAGNTSADKSVSFTLDTTAPTVSVTDPTGSPRTNRNVAISGVVHDALSGVKTLTARVDAGADFTVPFDATGHFSLTTSLLLDHSADGVHTLTFVAMDTAGNHSAPGKVTFTIDTTAPAVTVALDPASDTAPVGDDQTTISIVTLDGQTEPNLPVKLIETGANTTADASGHFAFAGVALALGANLFHVQATDAAGNVGSASRTITRTAAPCVFNDLTGWTIDNQGGSTTGKGTAAVAGDRVVIREGDSFHVALKHTFVIPAGATSLSFAYANLSFDTSSVGTIKDAFEASLLDSSGKSLVHTIGPGRDAFFNITEGTTPALGSEATLSGKTVTVNLSGIFAGTTATFILRLVNNDTDSNTSVAITCVNLPAGGNAVLGNSSVAESGTIRKGVTGVVSNGSIVLNPVATNPSGVSSNAIGNSIAPAAAGLSSQSIASAPTHAKLFVTTNYYDASLKNKLFRYDVSVGGQMVLEKTVNDPSFNQVYDLAISPSGELFATNRGGIGTVTRFTDIVNTMTSRGIISTNAFKVPFGAAFRGNELFVLDEDANKIFRFIVRDDGTVVANGAISDSQGGDRGITVSPWGELFVSHLGSNTIARYLIEGSGSAVANGMIAGNGLNSPHDLEFSPWGELFAANNAGGSISRFTFDANHVASANGVISTSGIVAPEGLAFSPWGDLYTANHGNLGGPNAIARYRFDASHAVSHSEVIPTTDPISDFEFYTAPALMPTLVIKSPSNNTTFATGSSILVTGSATAPTTINGKPVDVMDPAGNFFSQVIVSPGENVFNFTAIDAFGQTATATLNLQGTQSPTGPIDFSLFSDVSASFNGDYARTSFNEKTKTLYADARVRNTGQYPADAPLIVGVKNISDPTVRATGFDGVMPDGTPYYDFTKRMSGTTLAPGRSTDYQSLQFLDPNRSQFKYDLVFLGKLNHAPAITSVPVVEALAGRSYRYAATATDPDGDPLNFSLPVHPAGMAVDPVSGAITWRPTTADIGTRSATLRVEDGRGGFTEQRYIVSAITPPPNRPPVFTSVPVVESTVNTLYSYTAVATDPDSDPLTYSLVTHPAGMGIDPTTGLVSWTPISGQVGPQNVAIAVADGHGGTASQSFVVLVGQEPGNHPPVIVSQPVTTAVVGQPYTYPVKAIDPDSDPLTYLLTNAPQGMAINPSTGQISWTPSLPANVDSGPFVNPANGHTYYRLKPSNWTDAEASAVALGGHLVTINDQAENDWVFNTFSQPNQYGLWIGLNDAAVEGQFVWSSGEPVTFTAWARDQPDNNGNEDYGQLMVREDGQITYRSQHWNDLNNRSLEHITYGGVNQGVVEVNAVPNPAVTVRVDDGRGGFDTQSFTIDVSSAAPAEIHGTKFNDLNGNAKRDTAVEELYWSTDVKLPDGTNASTINRALLDGTHIQTVLTTPEGGRFQGIAFDELHGYMYSGDFKYLFRTRLDGSGRTDLVQATNAVGDVELDLLHGKVYWSEVGGAPRIRRANLDGSNAETIIQFPFGGLIEGIAIDPIRGKIYYALNRSPSAIGVANLDGTGQSTLWALSDTSSPFEVEIDVNAGKLYWNLYSNPNNFSTQRLQKANSDGTGIIENVLIPPQGLNNGIHFDAVNQKLYFNVLGSGADRGKEIDRVNPDGTGLTKVLRDPGLLVDHNGINYQEVAHIPEPGLAGWTIYLDANQNGRLDPGERSTITDADGNYAFTNLAAGTYIVREVSQTGWVATTPSKGFLSVTVATGQIVSGIDFGNQQSNAPPPANRPPAFTSTPPTIATTEQLVRYNATAFDPDSNPLTYDLVVKPLGMAVDPSTGIVVWKPAPNQLGNQQVILRVQDGKGGVDLQSFSIAVGRPNTNPDITSKPKGPAVVGKPWVYQVAAQDAEADPITFSLGAHPTGMVIDITTGLVTWTPTTPQIGSPHVEITASDNRGGSTTQFFDLPTVATATNDPPTITSTPRGSIKLGNTYRYQVVAADPNGDPLTYTLPTLPTGMTIDAKTGLVVWVPASGQLGSNPVQVRVDDGRGGFVTQTFAVTVVNTAVNHAPSIVSNPPQAATVARLYSYDLQGTDPDNDPLVWSLDTAPPGMSIDPTLGKLRWTPTAGESGLQNVVVRVSDGQGGFATQTYSITTRAVNLPPNIISTPVTTASVANPYQYAVRADDPENDPLTFRLTAAPTNMTIDAATGLISWTPGASQLGPQNVAIEVKDNQGGTGTQTYTLVVSQTAANLPPVITSTPSQAATVGTSYQYAVTANDPENEPLTFQLLANPAGMTINPATGLVNWTPTAAQVGNPTVIVAAVDASGGGTQTFTINTRAVNNPPTIDPIADQTITARLTFHVDVTAADPDNDPLTFSLDTKPSGMTIDAFGRISWPTTAGDPGTHAVAVTVDDGRGGVFHRSFNVVVQADTDAPKVSLAVNPSPVNIGSPVTIIASAIDNVGVVSKGLTVNGVALPLDAQGRISTVLNLPGGTYTLIASATDAAGNIGTDTKTLAIIDNSDKNPPVVAITAPADGDTITHTLDVIGTASDANLVSYTLSVAPAGSTAFTPIAAGTKSVTNGALGKFDPSSLANDSYTLRLQATDTGGNISTIDTTVNVTSDLKLGNFTLSFNDLTVPVSGIPITVTRTYDSMNAGTNGEFGNGWRLEFRDTNLRTSVPAPTPEEIDAGVFSPYRDKSHVYITVPGGKREGFTFKAVPKPGFAGKFFGLKDPTFVPDKGVADALSAAGATLIQGQDGGYYDANGLAYNPADPLNFGGVFTLTTKAGLAYTIDADTGLLNTVSDVSGNTLTFTDAAITSSAGPKVSFTRDPQGRIVSATDPAGKSVLYKYDAKGDLVAVAGRSGNTTTFVYSEPRRPHFLTEIKDPLGRSGVRTEYDSQGRLITLRDAAGNPVQISYDTAAFSETVKDALGNPTTFVYDDFGNVVEQINALGGHTKYTYDANNNLLTETGPNGRTTTNTFDSQNNLLTTADPLGNVTRNTYLITRPGFFAKIQGAKPVSYLAATTDPLGNTSANTYDGNGNLTSVKDAAGNVTAYTYDAAGNQTSIKDANGKTTSFEYDGAGRLMKQVDARGHATSYTYDPAGNQLTRTTTVSGRTLVTTTAYDANGHPTSVKDAEGHTTTTEYDALGRQKATVDALSHRTEFVYDTRGQLVETDFADGTKSTTTYDTAGHRIASTGRAGRTTKFNYDALGRLTETIEPDATPATDADNPRTKTGYDAAGQVLSQTDELGNKTTFQYDAAGRQTVVKDALGHESKTTYDTSGRRVSSTDPLNHTTAFAYDTLGRLTSTKFADGTTTSTTYDVLGRAIVQTDQLGRTTQYGYDELGRLTAVKDALGQTTSYGYDEAGGLISQKDANGHETKYEYDGLGRRTATVLPLGQRSTTSYDAVGNVSSSTDFNARTITYKYDNNNRLTTETFPDATTVSFTYTPTGQRQTVKDARGTTTNTYDLRDRLLSRTDPNGRSIAYTYDFAGNRTSVVIPSGTTTYTFDALNRTKTVTDPGGGVTTYTYDALGELVRTDQPNGTSEKREYDNVNHLTYLENDGPAGVISSYRYTLAPTGRREAVVEDTGRRVEYAYDALDRLLEEKITDSANGNRTIDYTYDPVGNRLKRNDSGEGVTTYVYDIDDRLQTETLGTKVTQYGYDANGNTTSKFTSAVDQALYEWDVRNRLIGAHVTDSSGTKNLKYQYDVDGIRVASFVDSAETRFLIDANQPYAQVLEEYTPGGVVVVSYVYGNDLISQNRGGVKSFYGVDGLGSTRALTNAAGIVTDRYIYDAFGRTIGQVGSTGNVYLFAGEQRDGNLGLDYLRARYLSVGTGRFYNQDPFLGTLKKTLSLNKYQYAYGNPVSNTDPSGKVTLVELQFTFAIGGILALAFFKFAPNFGQLISKVDVSALFAQVQIGFTAIAVTAPALISHAVDARERVQTLAKAQSERSPRDPCEEFVKRAALVIASSPFDVTSGRGTPNLVQLGGIDAAFGNWLYIASAAYEIGGEDLIQGIRQPTGESGITARCGPSYATVRPYSSFGLPTLEISIYGIKVEIRYF